jgi:hypothetical protein
MKVICGATWGLVCGCFGAIVITVSFTALLVAMGFVIFVLESIYCGGMPMRPEYYNWTRHLKAVACLFVIVSTFAVPFGVMQGIVECNIDSMPKPPDLSCVVRWCKSVRKNCWF